eukprot:jgi/Botrbrau1/21108/Bobra.0061s0003.1
MTRPQTRSQSKVSESNSSSTETMATPAGGSTASSGAGQSGQTTGGTAASSYAYTMNSSNPKMSTQLKADRTNFRAWREELESCAMQKGAMGALETAMPKTAENAAVKHTAPFFFPPLQGICPPYLANLIYLTLPTLTAHNN